MKMLAILLLGILSTSSMASAQCVLPSEKDLKEMTALDLQEGIEAANELIAAAEAEHHDDPCAKAQLKIFMDTLAIRQCKVPTVAELAKQSLEQLQGAVEGIHYYMDEAKKDGSSTACLELKESAFLKEISKRFSRH